MLAGIDLWLKMTCNLRNHRKSLGAKGKKNETTLYVENCQALQQELTHRQASLALFLRNP